jgi:excisionase family DNA binding protein
MEFVTIKELSKFLKVKESTLYSWVHNGLIPSHKLNGLVRFDMEEIETWLKASRKDPLGPELHMVRRQPQDIDSIVKKAVDSVKGKGYNPSNGKPGQHHGLRKEA